MGQHFLIDEQSLLKIVDAAGIEKDDEILEIGAGTGSLTRLLADRAKFVLAVEKDKSLFPVLKESLGKSLMAHTHTPKSSANVKLAFEDIMAFNFREFLDSEYKVVANIPYYITGRILRMLLASENKPKKITMLVQKEVAERIVADPGEMSVISVSAQMYSEVKIISVVSRDKFYPPPKVDSAILNLDVFKQPRIDVDEKFFFRIVRSCFAGRRKQLRNTLKSSLGLEKDFLNSLEAATGIDLSMRPQNLSLEQWVKIYDFVAKK